MDVTAYRAALDLLESDRYPFRDLPRRGAGFDDIEPLIQTMAGETDAVPPIHGVFAPEQEPAQ